MEVCQVSVAVALSSVEVCFHLLTFPAYSLCRSAKMATPLCLCLGGHYVDKPAQLEDA